jgi:hypothetical protein
MKKNRIMEYWNAGMLVPIKTLVPVSVRDTQLFRLSVTAVFQHSNVPVFQYSNSVPC